MLKVDFVEYFVNSRFTAKNKLYKRKKRLSKEKKQTFVILAKYKHRITNKDWWMIWITNLLRFCMYVKLTRNFGSNEVLDLVLGKLFWAKFYTHEAIIGFEKVESFRNESHIKRT